MKLYPLFADLSGRQVLVVGGGVIGERKAAALMEAGARVTVGAPDLTPALRGWAEQQRIAWRRGQFEESWLDDAWLVIAATSDAALHGRIAALAQARRVFVNVVDDASLSSFHVPAVIDRAPLTVAISSGGHAPVLARLLRERLEIVIDPAWSKLASMLGDLRARIRARLPDLTARRRFYDRLLGGPVWSLLRREQLAAARADAEHLLDSADARPAGSVVLVGAGPGDAGLLTLRGLRALNEADVILHDHLASDDVLALARRDAERIEVTKRSRHHTAQDHICALMLQHAAAGRRVVRLKWGDPCVFGHGGEELEFLRQHGIAYEVIPGVTAALACAAHAGIPLTHRDHAQSVLLVTAHGKHAIDALDWPVLAAAHQTLAVYMGVDELALLQQRLIEHGRCASTPFALIENGSRPEQRVVIGALADLAKRAALHDIRAPALLIVGEVAALAGTLAWFGQPPLGDTPRDAPAPLAAAAPVR